MSSVSLTSWKLRHPDPGTIELFMIVDGQEHLLSISRRQLWCLVSDGVGVLYRESVIPGGKP
jgi:hypothetical protein